MLQFTLLSLSQTYTDLAGNALCAVKNVLASLPQVVAPGHCHDILLITDASEVPIETCLSQLVEVDGSARRGG